MDVPPENINPEIVEIGKSNPAVRAVFSVYLSEVPVNDGEPLTWRETLELMVVKLAKQYAGALEGWKDSTKRAEEHIAEQKDMPLALVNENQLSVEVESELETLRRRDHMAKGILSKFMSPLRAAFSAKGRAEEAPPLVITQTMAEQIARFLSGENMEQYAQPDPCLKCGFSAWFVQDGEAKCAICDARAGKLKLVMEKQKLQQEKEHLEAELQRVSFLAEGKMGYE